MNVLVTGAGGFVGGYLSKALLENGNRVSAIVRKPLQEPAAVNVIVSNLSPNDDFQAILKGVDVVVHLAGRAHVMNDQASDPYQAYYDVNVRLTKALAEQAASCGVKRFVFLSSVKVNGESTTSKAFAESDAPKPEDDYGKTKYEAEKALNEIARGSAMDVVIIRPPLVYGKGVKANFKSLVQLLQLPIPLPLGSINNKRSMIYVENLVDFIVTCLTHEKAKNQTYLVSDNDDISISQLIRCIKNASNKKALLLPVSESWLKFIFKLIGKLSLFNRLCNNLQVDITKANGELNWQPPFTVEYGISKTINGD